MGRKLLAVVSSVILLFALAGCGAGECSICGATEGTKTYRNLSTEEKGALCAECVENAFGSPDQCAWCERETPIGFYINLLQLPVFVCQDCYDELS